MAVLKPISINPNNISLDAHNQIIISWKNTGDRQYYYQIKFYNNTDNSLVLDTTKISSYNSFHVINANILTNGITYKYQITVWNQNNQYATSDWVIFKCSSAPMCSIPNLGAEILNSNYTFQGSYSQAESVPIKSWRFILYDKYESIISTGVETFSNIIEYEIIGLLNDTDYYIELQVRSQDDILGTTGKIKFHVRYAVPRTTINLTAENVDSESAIRLSWHVTQVIGVTQGIITFINNQKINLSQGSIIFQHGLQPFKDFNLKLWLQWTPLQYSETTTVVHTCIGDINYISKNKNTEICRLKTAIGDIYIEWEYLNDQTSGRFKLINTLYGKKYVVYSETINPITDDIVFLSADYINKYHNIHTEIII